LSWSLSKSRGEDLLEEIKEKMTENKLTLSVAESCTGGALASLFTSLPGASKYFILGTVTYTNDMKSVILSVEVDTLAKYSAVSNEIAREMALGVKRISGSDIGISTTGYAGPDGGVENDPVGTVYVGLAVGNIVDSTRLSFEGSRKEIIRSACASTLEILNETLSRIYGISEI